MKESIDISVVPTPILQISSINGNEVYIKRDDLIPFSFGGNKARKAMLFFEDIKSKKSDYVITYGSNSSNHCRVIANMAKKYDLPCIVISPIEDHKETYNNKMVELFDAEVIRCHIDEVKETIAHKLESLKNQGFNPYFIAGGGHGLIGTKAYINCYNEIIDYEQHMGIFFDYIFLSTGTGTTQAGLICGKLIKGDDRSIIGISCARKNPKASQVIRESVKGYLDIIENESDLDEQVKVLDEYILDGYSVYNDEILEIIRDLLCKDGIPLDSTYTAKAFWGMKQYIVKEQVVNKKILFLHTGGTPLFFNDLEKL